MQPEIRAVVFDWGGVLLRICRSMAEGLARAELRPWEGHERDDLLAERKTWVHLIQIGEMPMDEFYTRVAGQSRGAWTTEDVRRLHDRWLIEEYDGAEELTRQLAAIEGLVTGMLSNTNAAHWARQFPRPDGAGPDFTAPTHLEHRMASQDLGLAKPGVEIYHAAAEVLGLARNPGAILFFDDLEENVHAARDAGWQSEQIDHTADTAAQMRDHLRAKRVL
ncbi:MAG: HAD-IA family hydrolase [Planctomycetota bacterium]